MISSFFQKGIDSGELFDRLKISEADDCQKYKNKYNVIRIDFSKMPRNCESYRQYIERVEELLISDLREAYPDAKTSETDAIGDILEEIFQQYHGEKFIFVLDECSEHTLDLQMTKWMICMKGTVENAKNREK